MYHHHSQQQGPPQPSSNRPGPTHHQQQQQNSFKYPPPSHLPDELVSTMATRGSGDIDHCLMDLMNRPSPNQRSQPNPDQMSGTAGYSSNQLGHQQGMDWSNYPHPSQMFASPPSTVTQQSQSSPSAIGNQAWMQAPVYDPPSPQTRGSHGGGNGGGGVVDKQGLYTPERAESILATLGLSNEDLEFLSQYPEDQLNPDNLPFILRFIQTNKSKSQNSVASSSYSQSASGAIHDILPPPARSGINTGRLRSPEVPRYHSVQQAAGKVIDYGHASQATDDSSGRESMPERRYARLQPFEPNKHVDLDYCRSGGEVHKNNRLSPAREFPPLYRSRHPDREYSRDGPRPSPSSETWNDSSSSSRHPVLKSHGTTMRLPTPTMMCDFSAESPKVYPHTCSLCEVDCEHAKDWIEHVRSVKHTDSCRDLRNKYPEWKHKLPRREHSLGQDDSQTTWHTKERSRSMSRSPTPSSLSCKRRIPSAFAFSTPAGHSRRERSPVKDDSQTTWHAKERSPISLSHSWSPSPSPSPDKHRGGPHSQRQYRRSYQTPRHSYHRHHQATGSSSRDGLKRPRDVSARHDDSARRKLPSSDKSPMKTKLKPVSKWGPTKPGSSEADDTSAKGPPAKKMKKVSTQSTPSCTAACLVYLTGIPTTATEQEVKTWVRDFGKYNNVVLLSGSEADQGQKASVCMGREEDALALAQCSSLSIGDQPITATLAKKPEADDSTAVSKGTSIQELSAIGGDDSGNGPELDKKTGEEFSSNSTVLITGLPASGWTESDVIKLCQPFGAPSDIILATQSGKALLLMPDAEMAEEMVKNHSVAPMKINDSELKMTNLEQAISLNTPVALYNLLNPTMGARRLVRWNHLLVIRNIPDTPTASSEVQKLVERIGMVHNILVLNHNMIICEMLTAGAVVRIRNHYHRFPCIVQSNPLYFTSWRDPIDQNLVWGPRWLPPSLDSLKESPDDDKDDHTVPTTDKEDSIRQEIGKHDYLVELCHEGRVIGFHCQICDSRVDSIGIDPMHIDAHLNGKRHEMLSSQSEEYVEEINKNINLRRFYCHLCKCYINDLKSKILHLKGRKHIASMMKNQLDYKRARKVKRAKLRDETGEKTSSKDEAAGKAASKERKSKDQQDIKVGEELSDAAPTQVEADVKTDKIKVSPSKQRKERKTINTSREKLDKINSGPRETKSSSSAAGDGEASSSKPANLELPKVELEEDQFQDFPDLQDFVTVDEVGDANDFPISPPPGAVAMDTTVTVDKKSPADDKDSHTVPTADKKDSTPQENEKAVPGEKKKAVKMDNRNAEGDAKISGEDEYFDEISLNGTDRLHCKICNGIFLKEFKEEHLKGRRHKISLQLLGQKSKMDEYLVEFCNRRGKVNLHCKICKCNIGLDNQENHLKTKTHRRVLELKRDFDAKKLKEGELRDDTDEKTISKDEAAGKERSKDRQDIKESPDDDKDGHIVLTPQQNGTYDHLVDVCYDGTAIDFFCTLCEIPLRSRGAIFVDSHLNGKMHKMLLSLSRLYRGEKSDKIEILSEDKCIVAINGRSTIFYCSLCKCKFKVQSKFDNGHLNGKQHIASLWERMKDGKLNDYTDENTSTKDEAAGKELSKDQQDIKVGEELSNAAPTQVCNPEADVKTDNAISSQLLVENSKLDEYVEEVHNRDGRVVLLSCKVCKCGIKVDAKDEHLKSETHLRRLELKCYLDVKKPTGGQLRDNTEEKINSNAALTQVCSPEADVKKVKIKMALAIQPEERKSSPEELDKINSVPKETKSSSSAAVDGEDSSCKPAHLELPKVESEEEDQFHDFPFDMTDFVTVDEVGDVNDITGPPPPPPDAVATDTTATVEEAGDESDLPACPPPPAVVPMDTSEAVVMAKSTEEERESEAGATPVPEDTPRGSPGPLTLATAAPETFETTATNHSESLACVESTLDPVVTDEQHPHSPVPPQAMCSSDQLDAPVPLPVADDSLPASAPATTASSPKGATTPPEACSSGVTPTAGGEQENQGPVSHSQAEEEVTEKVEQMEDEEDKEKTAASVAAKRRIPEEKEEEPMQKKQKAHGATADSPPPPPPPPPFDPNSAVGLEFLVPKKGFFCKLCNRFFTGGRESELNHCKSQKHHENWQKYLKSKKTTSR